MAPTVGIVIALIEEFKHLFDVLQPQAVWDSERQLQYYRFDIPISDGRSVTAVALFVGAMGPTRAALATQALCLACRPSLLINMGIAGALSGDVGLGDVVVADQADSYLENGKAVPAADRFSLQLSGEVFRSDHAAVSGMQNFAFTSPELYSAFSQGASGRARSLPAEVLKFLDENDLAIGEPRVHFGHIASGPIVGSSEAFAEWLKGRDRRYLALEMESGGVLAAAHVQAVPGLIVRGVSDFSDRRKKALDRETNGAIRALAMLNAMNLLIGGISSGGIPLRDNQPGPH